MKMRSVFTAVLLLTMCVKIAAQDKPANLPSGLDPFSASLLGPDDQLTIRVADVDEISDKPVRISSTGFITLPLAGRIHAAGMTVEQLESEIAERLDPYLNEPTVSVTRMEIRSQPVSVIGAVASPGVHQLQGQKTLVEMLSMAGGLKEDSGYKVRVTRRLEWGRIPLSDAADDPTGEFSFVEISLPDLTDGKNPALNIPIMPNDVISVAKAEMVYVIGDVGKSGAIMLGGRQQVTVLQAVSIAGGAAKTAKTKQTKILRLDPASAKRTEISIDLAALLGGKVDDVPMQPEDILYVPSGSNRNLTTRALESVLQIGTGVAILSVRP
jgi:polysaccharide export outer membrane protein